MLEDFRMHHHNNFDSRRPSERRIYSFATADHIENRVCILFLLDTYKTYLLNFTVAFFLSYILDHVYSVQQDNYICQSC